MNDAFITERVAIGHVGSEISTVLIADVDGRLIENWRIGSGRGCGKLGRFVTLLNIF